ncbi:MAG: prepilin-type N-terminal cleavage/methylation domain-containing protein [Kiritimatiellia bacterium]|jgi:prepilin-type N-terminal cleavage/methylation domain-containing protein|nr:prepilin-type N-terminal cleavage/methylation domain-containing protein [Kiritimatiellia bacterium]
MARHLSSQRAEGFTLIEVLTSLGLCAVLAVVTTSAVVMAGRAERSALRQAEASLLLPSLYAAQRLRPDELLRAPRGWTLQHTSHVTPLPDGTLREWHHIILATANQDIRPVALDILDDRP